MSQTGESDTEARGPFHLGDWTVEPTLNRITRGADSVQLEPRLMNLLVLLSRHPAEVLSPEAIVRAVWAQQFLGEGVLRRAVASLRERLGDDAKAPTYIETISKRGYRLIARPVPLARETASVALDEAEPVPVGRARLRPRFLVSTLGVVLLIGVVSVVVWRARQSPVPWADPNQPKRLVVLPFMNLGPSEHEYFADGMTVELINRLATVRGLHVISKTTAMKYKGSLKSIPEIGDELGVQYALEGEVRWEPMAEGAGRVRISPQLILIAEDRNIWADQFDREVESFFAVQSEIAQQVIEQLDVDLAETEIEALEARPTDNIGAYNAYLRGLDHLDDPFRGGFDLATAMFQRAVELDPEFALAHAALSHVHRVAAVYRSDLDPERGALAKRAADRALELDPNLPEGHFALGKFYAASGDRERALAEYRVALALRPNDAEVLMALAGIQRGRGQLQEAVDHLQRAVEFDPQNDRLLQSLAYRYMLLRRYPEAADIIDRAIAVAPDKGGHYFWKHMIYLGWHGPSSAKEVIEKEVEIIPGLAERLCVFEMELRNYEAALACFERASSETRASTTVYLPNAYFECQCYEGLGEADLARQKCEEALDRLEGAAAVRPDDPVIRSTLGLVYARLGRKEDAIREGEWAVAQTPVSEYPIAGSVRLMQLAIIYAHVREPDKAFDTIEHVLSIPADMSVKWLDGSTWDPLRDHPRFAQILERYGEEE